MTTDQEPAQSDLGQVNDAPAAIAVRDLQHDDQPWLHDSRSFRRLVLLRKTEGMNVPVDPQFSVWNKNLLIMPSSGG
ncbi:MAG: hypothetical protein R3C62_23050 [Chloroflexota bacterium]